MEKGKNRDAGEAAKRFRNLNLSNDFLFGEVMQDEETCKAVLEIIMNRKVYRITNLSKEKHADADEFHKGVRFDVYFEDDRKTVYSVEMQNRNRYNLPKRSRHYQSMIDIKLLPGGEVDYDKMKDGVIIFICTFDAFDRGRYRYTFENRCIEEPDLKLGDGTRKIFLNTEGKKKEGVEPELIEFLRYIKDTIHTKPETEPVQRISKRVKMVKEDAVKEAKYMMSLVHDNEIRYEARLEGKEEGQSLTLIRLILKKKEKGLSVSQIAQHLEEDEKTVQCILDVIRESGSEEPEEIYKCVKK